MGPRNLTPLRCEFHRDSFRSSLTLRSSQLVELTSPEDAKNIREQNESFFVQMIRHIREDPLLLATAACFLLGVMCSFLACCCSSSSSTGRKGSDFSEGNDGRRSWDQEDSESSLFCGDNPMRAGVKDNEML